MRTPTLTTLALLLLAASPIGCDDPEESMPLLTAGRNDHRSDLFGHAA